uniref:Uncharacterized protein n=1 Tax=Nelumbo nucifera TaxID=4432 RepID=A0A822XSS6_NELNU|nr:TPA_asm: hypothetical protein HUJ06_021971 [Nelumbo nucifera]
MTPPLFACYGEDVSEIEGKRRRMGAKEREEGTKNSSKNLSPIVHSVIGSAWLVVGSRV